MLAATIAIIAIFVVITFICLAERQSKQVRTARAERIIMLLNHTNDHAVKLKGIETLGQLDVDIATARIIQALQDGSQLIRDTARTLLIKAGENAVKELQELRELRERKLPSFIYHSWVEQRWDRFIEKANNRIVPGLAAILAESDGQVREVALAALREIGTPLAMMAIDQAELARMLEPRRETTDGRYQDH